MNSSGVFCKPKSSTEVYNSILVDEYTKCIFDDKETEVATNMDLPSSSKESTKETTKGKWEVGDNVRAPYYHCDDEDYYEAKIIKILDDEFVLVEYFGYEDQEVVKLDELLVSRGQKMIEEQIEQAKREFEEYEEDVEEEDGNEEEPIDWKVSMPCRAYYEPMDLIYEATVQALDPVNEKATVAMTGYDLTYTVDICDLYRSDPILREKQLKQAVEWKKSAGINEAQKQLRPGISHPKVTTQDNESVNCNDNPSKFRVDHLSSTSSTYAPHSQRILQPKDEKEAIACLISANYLCGYYAGYYDCLKNNKSKKQSDT